MKKLHYLLLILLLGLASCREAWNEHYGAADESGEVISPLNLLDYLKSIPEYSRFVEKLEETGLAGELTRDQYLSVWVVNNDQMEALEFIDWPEKFVMQYHINNLSYDLSKLKTGLRLRTLSGKYLPVQRTASEEVQLGDSHVLRGNQFCRNGVVHEINELMVPDESIYEYLYALGDAYSIIRDSVFALNDTVFDTENSIPTGVDQTGNTLYDSVFVIQNPIFEKVDFRSEFSQVTMFLPSNEVIRQCFADLGVLYEQFGKEFSREDSLVTYNWIRDAVFYEDIIGDYGNQLDLISAADKVWRTTVQQVNPDHKRMSNGRIYEVTYLKIPNNVHIQMIKQLFHYYDFAPEELKPSLFTFHNATDVRPDPTDNYSFPSINVSGTYTILRLTGDLDDGEPLAVDFTPVRLDKNEDGSTTAKVVEVPPGEYNLYMGFQSKSHPFVNIYVDGKPVATDLNVEPSNPWNYDRSTNTVSGTKWNGWGGLAGIINIDGDEVRSFKIRVEFAGLGKGSVEELKIYHWALVPTQNNY